MIVCCREDHLPGSPRYDGTNKIHFDLANYGVMFWNVADLDSFKRELREKIELRIDLIKREEDARREAPRRLKARRQRVVDLISKDVQTSLNKRLKILTQREQERLATTWKKRS